MGDALRSYGVMLKSARRFKILLFIAGVLALNLGGSWLAQQIQFQFQLFPRHDSLLQIIVLGTAALYLLLMATPFMPAASRSASRS